jgi:hypothetical protein
VFLVVMGDDCIETWINFCSVETRGEIEKEPHSRAGTCRLQVLWSTPPRLCGAWCVVFQNECTLHAMRSYNTLH